MGKKAKGRGEEKPTRSEHDAVAAPKKRSRDRLRGGTKQIEAFPKPETTAPRDKLTRNGPTPHILPRRRRRRCTCTYAYPPPKKKGSQPQKDPQPLTKEAS